MISLRSTHSELCYPEEEGEEGNHNEENRLEDHGDHYKEYSQ